MALRPALASAAAPAPLRATPSAVLPRRLIAGRAPGFGIIHHVGRKSGRRYETVVNVFRDGVCSDKSETLLEGVDMIPKGAKMEGRFFPLLYQP